MIATPVAMLDEAAAVAPGLRAALVYLRPIPRRRLLSVLADLGVFVAECPDAASAFHCASRIHADILIVVGDDDPQHAQVALDLRRALAAALVVIVPTETPAYASAGASACMLDDEIDRGEFAQHIELVARRARELQRPDAPPSELVVFGDITLRMTPGELVRNARTVRLTDAEKAMLLHLARSLGQPVAASELEHQVAAATRSGGQRRQTPALVTQLRRKVRQLGGDAMLLASIRRFGYILIS